MFRAARLAWFWMTATWPDSGIDHRNGIPSDDSWINLRQATQTQNNGNSRIRRNHAVGLKGVSFSKFTGRYKAHIGSKQIGRFDTAEEAHAAYVAAAKKYFSEFARSV